MRHLLVPLALVLVATSAPLGAAGPGLTFDTLESEGGCVQERGSTTREEPRDGGTFTRRAHVARSSCDASGTYATLDAHDDAGRVAGARAWRAESSDDDWTGTSDEWRSADGGSRERTYDSEHGESAAWSRGVEADALGAAIAASSGCHRRFLVVDHHEGRDTPEKHERNGTERVTSSSGCRDAVAVTEGGRSTSLSYATACAGSRAGGGRTGGSGNGPDTHAVYEETDEDACRTGADADAAGLHAFAGDKSRCRGGSSYERDGPTSWESRWRSCQDWRGVEAPAGSSAGLVSSHSARTECENDECEREGGTSYGVNVVWGEAPGRPVERQVFLVRI